MILSTGLLVLGLFLAMLAMNSRSNRWTAALGVCGGLAFVLGLRFLS